jgi:hypothetical protein
MFFLVWKAAVHGVTGPRIVRNGQETGRVRGQVPGQVPDLGSDKGGHCGHDEHAAQSSPSTLAAVTESVQVVFPIPQFPVFFWRPSHWVKLGRIRLI